MFETLKSVFKVKEMRRKLLYGWHEQAHSIKKCLLRKKQATSQGCGVPGMVVTLYTEV